LETEKSNVEQRIDGYATEITDLTDQKVEKQ
jgi:hypothetical protein